MTRLKIPQPCLILAVSEPLVFGKLTLHARTTNVSVVFSNLTDSSWRAPAENILICFQGPSANLKRKQEVAATEPPLREDEEEIQRGSVHILQYCRFLSKLDPPSHYQNNTEGVFCATHYHKGPQGSSQHAMWIFHKLRNAY